MIFDGINFNGVEPRHTFEEVITFFDYPIRFLDRAVPFTKDLALLTQLGGIGMMELEERQRREMVERQKEDMIREIAAATRQFAQMLRTIRRIFLHAPTGSLTYDRRDDINVLAQDVVHDLAVAQNRFYRDRISI